jgi:ornithine cyclodeaminase
MLIINEKTIEELTDPVELTDVMEKAMLTYSRGDFIMPDRSHMDFDGNTLLLMPSKNGNYIGTKVVTLFPGNRSKGEPVLYGTVILNDGNSGKPVAILNGAKLTAVRTAAVGSAGIRHTSPDNASSLGVIGAGVQGYNQAVFACRNRPIKKIFIYDNFSDRLRNLHDCLVNTLEGVEIVIARNADELCRNSEIIITATNSCYAVLPDDQNLLKGKSIIAIGSYKPEMVELPDSLFPLLENVFIDVEVAIEESGDLIHPISKGILRREQIKVLSDILEDKISINKNQTTLYKSVGMALFDLFAASYFYQKALESGTGVEVLF